MSEDTKQRFEILKMAREMLNEEYTFKRATDHNKWLAESQEVWTKYQKTIPHPPFAPYPTEREVLEAAIVLYNFVHNQEVKPQVVQHVEVPVVHHTPPPIPEPVREYKPIPEGDFVFPRETVKEIVEEPVKETEEEPQAGNRSQQISKGLLPGWIRRTSK